MYRQIRLTHQIPNPDAIAIGLFEKSATLPPIYAGLDKRIGGIISAALKRSEFSAAKGVVTTLYSAASDRGEPARIFVLGLGDREKFNNESVRIAAARLLRAAYAANVERLNLLIQDAMEGRLDRNTSGRAIGDGLAMANFDFEQFKGAARSESKKSGDKRPRRRDLVPQTDAGLREFISRSLVIGDSVNLTRTLAATPPNVAHTTYLCDFARRMAREVGLRCTIINAAQARQLHMGGLLAVGAEGSHPPAMIVLEHGRPHAGKKSEGPVLLVGKAVTFDTGGVSIKPADNMDKMKYDKCGGMAVIGAMQAIARLKLPIHVIGLVPTAENMLSDKAYRPGDIITHANGVTSEIINTDAEGRLILADALSYGTRTFKPRAVIDLATLTGACVVALGTVCAGAFCGDRGFRGRLFDAAEFTGERLWHMPLWDEHRQAIKGTHGDILNAGGREAGACTAAAFLSFFIEPDGPRKLPELPWCHLDIAGVADVKADTPLSVKGPTGYGVRLLVRAIETWA